MKNMPDSNSEQLRLMSTPRSIDVEITKDCNLRCRYCYFFGNEAVTYEDLPTKEWLSFFEECGRYGVMRLVIAGGEPFLREDLCELLDGVVANGMRFSLLSNGGRITDEVASYIAATGRCNHIQISIDGSTAQIHDASRGRGSFDAAVRGVNTLRRHGIQVEIRTTITRYNLADLENTARFLLDDLGLPSFSTNAAGYLGACRQRSDQILLDVADRQEAMRVLLELERKYNGRITASAGPLAEAKAWRKMLAASEEKIPSTAGGGYLSGCGCTSNKLAVRSDGTYVPCSLLPHMSLGKINQDDLKQVWQTADGVASLRSRRKIPLSDFALCSSCDFQAYCTGNCPATAYTLNGDVNAPSLDACLLRFLNMGGSVPVDEEMC